MSHVAIRYQIRLLDNESLDQKLEGIALEQSVELPSTVISDEIGEQIVGKITRTTQQDADLFEAEITYPVANAAPEIVQFLNVLFGNVSLKPGVRILSVNWAALTSLFKGPRFGIDGIRDQLNIPKRPLSCTALKPMGFSPEQLAELAYEFAMGGIDLIKDDHGLADQVYAPFEARVAACSAAVRKANQQTGRNAVYMPNITAGIREVEKRLEIARKYGCGGVLFSPHLTGLEAMHILAHHAESLPIMAHPAFSGAFVTSPDNGFAPAFLYGELYRALGADFSIYPNTGGRFSFSLADCQAINEACRIADSPFRTVFPTPGGGVKWEDIPKWTAEYGTNTVFLMGGSLYQHENGIRQAAADVLRALESSAS